MSRTSKILIVILALAIVGGGGWLWWKKDSIVWPGTKFTNSQPLVTNQSGVVTTITNTPAKTSTLPNEVKGDTKVEGVLKVGEIEVKISSMQRMTKADGFTADTGKSMLAVHFDQLAAVNGAAVNAALQAIQLMEGKTSYPLQALKVASPLIKNDRGHMTFMIPTTASSLQLVLGTGADAQRVSLP